MTKKEISIFENCALDNDLKIKIKKGGSKLSEKIGQLEVEIIRPKS